MLFSSIKMFSLVKFDEMFKFTRCERKYCHGRSQSKGTIFKLVDG